MNPNSQLPQDQQQQQPQQIPTTQPVFNQATASGLPPATAEYNKKQLIFGWVLAIASPVVLIVVLLFGWVLAATAIGSAYAASIGIRQKKIGLIVVGAIGTLAGLGLYLAAIIME